MIIECIMESSSLFALLAFVAACFLAAIPGAVFRPGVWYERLVKPRWRPPNWLFAPIWSVLYLTIAVSGWLVWWEAGFAGAARRDRGLGGRSRPCRSRRRGPSR